MRAQPGKLVLRALLLVACAAVLVRSVRQAAEAPPLYNWDLVSYTALAMEWEDDDPATLHQRTYGTLREELPPEVFSRLTTGLHRRARYDHPAIFYDFLPLQRERFLYTYPIYLLHHWGDVAWSRATWWISRGAWFALACLIVIWSARAIGFDWGVPVGTLLAHLPSLVAQMSRSNPDLQATFHTCLGVFVLIELRKHLLGAVLLSSAVLVRPDSILLPVFLALTLALLDESRRPSRRALVAWVGATWLVQLAAAKLANACSWWQVFTLAYRGYEFLPTRISKQPDWDFYFEVLGEKARALPYPGYSTRTIEAEMGVEESTLPLVFAGLLLAGLHIARRSPAWAEFQRYRALLAALLASSVVHWVLWPRLGDRFFAPVFVCVPLVFLSMAQVLVSREER